MTNQMPKGMREEMKKAPIGEEPVLQELQPVVDRSEPVPSAPPVKKKNHALWRTRRYWVYY